MYTIRNEKGYALLLVMLMVVLFTIIGMGLLSMNMNAAKQFNLKEEQVQARHQAEMGILHYGAVLKERVKNSSASILNCSDIDKLLGSTKKIIESKYIVEPLNIGGTSCVPIENGKRLEIKIKSRGIINGNTEKQIEATFYAANEGTTATTSPNGGVTEPPVPTSPDTVIIDTLSMKKDTEVYDGNLKVKNLVFLPGNGNNLSIKKDLYISGLISMQNHDCIAAGGNFIALNDFAWGHSHTDILVRKDAYLPSVISGWKKDHTNLYVFGNVFLPQTYTYNIISGDRELYVGGKVYQLKIGENGIKKYVEITNPFKSLGDRSVYADAANNLTCAIPATPTIPGTPKWVLLDEKIIDYQ